MINRAVVNKELREIEWKLIVGAILLTVTGVSVPLLYRYVIGILEEIPLPAVLGRLVGEQLRDFGVYLWSNWYGKNLYQGNLLFGILTGMGLASREVAGGTAGFLLTRPVRRSAVFASKCVAGLGGLLALNLVSTAAIAVSTLAAGYPLNPSFLVGLVPAAVGVAFFHSVAAYASTLFPDPVKSGVASAVVLLGLGVPGIFRSTARFSVHAYIRGAWIFSGPAAAWTGTALVAVASAALYVAAARRFDRLEA